MEKKHLDLLYEKRAEAVAAYNQMVREMKDDQPEDLFKAMAARKDERYTNIEVIDAIISSYVGIY